MEGIEVIRVDSYPTHEKDGIKYRIGKVLPYGASIVPNGVNFSIFSKYATSCELLLYNKGEKKPYAVIPFPEEFRIGDVFSMIVFDIDYETVEYGYRMNGEYNPQKGFRFNKDKVLLDPYAKAISGRNVWGEEPDYSNEFQHRGKIVYDDFDWDDYNSDPSLIVLKKTVETEGYGATYDVTSRLYRDEVWLCPVMLHVFGEYPDELKIIIF